MAPIRNVLRELETATIVWRQAVHAEDRAAENDAMKAINRLLDLLSALRRARPQPSHL